MLISIASAKGSPGASTSAHVLAAVWPRPAVLAELDPAGSDLVYRATSGEYKSAQRYGDDGSALLCNNNFEPTHVVRAGEAVPADPVVGE